ncbi:MAG: anhydro-N-acetylmuramic acid kinase, partial [Proteobacteria bacterium]|nr:anhydro-N-acetylmuramic acid kinase [Pseudomonadota bacterium]
PWLLEHLAGRDIAARDVQATLLALTIESIAREVLRCEAERVILCGGGARNSALRDGLHVALEGIPVQTADEHGLDSDFVEATAFAWLARERLAERPGNIPSVTGADRPAILGAVYLP